MTDQELRKLSRKDLLELLISVGRERDDLQAELDKTKAALEDRKLCIEQAGSLADAALRLNGVFESAQAAARQYLENIRLRSEHIDELCARKEASYVQREAEIRHKIELRLQEAEKSAQEIEAQTRRNCQAMENEARERSEAYWTEVIDKLQKLHQDHKEREGLPDSGGGQS